MRLGSLDASFVNMTDGEDEEIVDRVRTMTARSLLEADEVVLREAPEPLPMVFGIAWAVGPRDRVGRWSSRERGPSVLGTQRNRPSRA